MKKVQGHTHLVKDNNGAVLVTDKKVYEKAKVKKKERERLNNLENRLNRIEQLLTKLVDK